MKISFGQVVKVSPDEVKSIRNETLYVVTDGMVYYDFYEEEIKKVFNEQWKFCKFQFIHISDIENLPGNSLLLYKQYLLNPGPTNPQTGITSGVINGYRYGIFRMFGKSEIELLKKRFGKSWHKKIYSQWVCELVTDPEVEIENYNIELDIKSFQFALEQREKGEKMRGRPRKLEKIFSKNDELDSRILVINKDDLFIYDSLTTYGKIKSIYKYKFEILNKDEIKKIVESQDDKYCIFDIESMNDMYFEIKIIKNSTGQIVNYIDYKMPFWGVSDMAQNKIFTKLLESINYYNRPK